MSSTKYLLIGMLFMLVIALSLIYIDTIKEDSNKIVPTIQYSKPIGPTQSEPYILESKLIIEGD